MIMVFAYSVMALPCVAALLFSLMKKVQKRNLKYGLIIALQAVICAFSIVLLCSGDADFGKIVLSSKISFGFRLDAVSKIFSSIIAFGWFFALLYSCEYLKHEQNEERFLVFMFLSETAMFGVELASGLVTMYVFFEMLTLLSMPLVLHSLSQESIRAAMKYLFYSVGGAFLALFGIFVFHSYAETLDFVKGGSITSSEGIVLVAVLLSVIGFGAKAGLFPLHGWLPTAHPVAPAPASALLSGLIAKAGVITILRVLFFVVGVDNLVGTWVQTTLIILALITVFMGSMMAYTEKVFKKRLAFSTVSQISYVLVGLFMMTSGGVEGALLQVIFHASIKCVLFFTAGACIYLYGYHHVDELHGLGKNMPLTFISFFLASLSLIGIPPTGGFVSKWVLATAALEKTANLGAFSWIIPAVLLVSALLTAGYLLPIGIKAFFVGKEEVALPEKKKEPIMMLIPMIVLAVFALLCGIFSTPVTDFVKTIVSGIV